MRKDLEGHIRGILKTFGITTLCQATADLDRALKAKSKSHPITRRLMTIPGIGPLVSLSFVALVDDPDNAAQSRNVRNVDASLLILGAVKQQLWAGQCFRPMAWSVRRS